MDLIIGNAKHWGHTTLLIRWIIRDLPRVKQVTTDHTFSVILDKLDQQSQSQQSQSTTTIATVQTENIIHLKSTTTVTKAAK